MREIKFRAWDNVKKVMFEVTSFTGMDLPIEDKFNYVTGLYNITDRKDVDVM